MAIGRCKYMVCDSTVGSSFRALAWQIDENLTPKRAFVDLTICPTHERLLKAQERAGDRINVSLEGFLYLESWIVSPLFEVWG